jgi:hypothetical protein
MERPSMRPRIFNLDDSFSSQKLLLRQCRTTVHDFREWGPTLRLGCGFRRFARFEEALTRKLGAKTDTQPVVNFVGSGDFHHVSLALLRRIPHPFHLLILDNHPDWMRGIPFLHCGTWVYHSAQLPNVQSIFHVGGNVDFDNGFRWLAPWPWLRSGKIKVIPATRRYERGAWSDLVFPVLRAKSGRVATTKRISQIVDPYRAELARWPLYVSLDKDVLTSREAVVNWDSGNLTFREVFALLNAFAEAAKYRFAGMDVVGDWSPLRLQGFGRRVLHWTEHPRLTVSPTQATECNQKINLEVVEWAQSLERDQALGREQFGILPVR